MVQPSAPTVRLTASVSAFAGEPPVTVIAHFLATRPLEQMALESFNAALPGPGYDDAALDPAERRAVTTRINAALIALFDASCVEAQVLAAGDRDPRPCPVSEIDGRVKVAMAEKLVSEREVRLNERGQ